MAIFALDATIDVSECVFIGGNGAAGANGGEGGLGQPGGAGGHFRYPTTPSP